jgi:hypothetical protein
MKMSFTEAVHLAVDGFRRFFQELYKTPPGC